MFNVENDTRAGTAHFEVRFLMKGRYRFFFIYLMVWACISLREWTGMEWPLLTNTMESAMGTVAFCPMLAILFVGTRMRALQMTNNKGAPQGWAQDSKQNAGSILKGGTMLE